MKSLQEAGVNRNVHTNRCEWGSRTSDAVPDTVVTLLPLGWGYSVTAYGGAAATGLGHSTLEWGTCIHQAGRWWCWMAVKCV